MTDFFLLSTCLVLSQYTKSDAGAQLARQSVEYKEMDRNVTEYLDRRINESLKIRAGQILFVSKTLFDRQIIWELKF